MIGPRIDASNAGGHAARLVALGDTVVAGLPALVRTHALLLQTKVRARASGRPGPNAPTGDYRRSISVVHPAPGVAHVGTNRPQGRRLEFGFHGVDALGRAYNQPPYPHFQPAGDEVRPVFRAAAFELMRRANGGG